MTNTLKSMTDHIIFATNFSDACHAAIPAVTRWVDAHAARLSLVHVYNPEKTLHRDAQAMMHSFYAEADNYPNCDRHLIAGDAFEGITSFCKGRERALLFMPPSDRTGLLRPFHVSTRARVLREVEIPVWTMGQATLNTGAAVAGRNIAVWVQDFQEDRPSVIAAAAHAERHKATLHILHLVPETDEGTMISAIYSDAPLGIESATEALNELAAGLPSTVKVQIHAHIGHQKREFHAFLRESEAELLIVNRTMALQESFLRPSFHSVLQSCKIPMICLPNAVRASTERVHAAMLQAAELSQERVSSYSRSSYIVQR